MQLTHLHEIVNLAGSIYKQDTWAGVNLHCRVANLRKVAWEVFGNSYRAFNR